MGRRVRRPRPERCRGQVTHSRDFGLKFPVVRDKHGSLARKLGAKVTPEAFVIDDAGQVRYHGRIDDQFAARQKRNANPSENELKDAIAAVLNGKEVAKPFVEAVGCPLPEVPRRGRSADLLQGRGADPSEELPGVPPAGPGRAVSAGDLRPGAQAGGRHRRGRRGSGDAPLEGSAARRRQVQGRADSDASRRSPPSSPGPRQTLRKATRPTCRRPPNSPTTGSSARPTWFSTSAPISKCPPAARTSIAALSCRPASRKTSTSRPSNSGRETAASSITSWPMSTSPEKPASAIRPTRGPAIPASAVPATRSTAAWAAGRPATCPASSTKESAGRCRERAMSSFRCTTILAARQRPIAARSASISQEAGQASHCTGAS